MKKMIALAVALCLSILAGCAGTKTEEAASAQTTITQPSNQNPNEYRKEQFGKATFEIPTSWFKSESENNIYFSEGPNSFTPFINVNISPIDLEITPDAADVFWDAFVSEEGVENYRKASTSHHEFILFEFVQIFNSQNNKEYMVSSAATIATKEVYTIRIIYENSEPNKEYYDPIFEYVVESFFVEEVAAATGKKNNENKQ